ncbi:MAG: hypothetical protein M1819_004764 [Sarea resinae]|nr:MAG: hypothetical protein M1819_004764 [Sarea resinae]
MDLSPMLKSLLFMASWSLKGVYAPATVVEDGVLFIFATIISAFWGGPAEELHHIWHCFYLPYQTQIAVTLGAPVAVYSLWTAYHGISSLRDAPPSSVEEIPLGRPLLFPSQTTHVRLFPRKHSFAYSYFVAGIPIGWQGCIRSVLSAGDVRKRAWFHVNAADYLGRETSVRSLEGKLHAYLESQGVDPSDYPFSYLVTAPRFLGYSFNPVSFWYLYSPDKELGAMILEVNNTFDERRPYFLKRDETKSDVRGSSVFTNRWGKDFHVSPFNSRHGSYSLVAHDPLSKTSDSRCPLDITITLNSSGDHAKLVARAHSTGPAIDPTALDVWSALGLIASWWWVGFVTSPRIIYQAGILFFRRNLPVFARPEVRKSSVARRETQSETILEGYFRKYLKHQIQCLDVPMSIDYVAAAGDPRRETISNRSASGSASTVEALELRVLSPAFYSRFIHYPHILEAFDREMLCTREENRTVWVSKPSALPLLFPPRQQEHPLVAIKTTSNLRFLERARWALVRRLRCPPAPPAYTDESAGPKGTDIRHFPLSALDEFVISHCAPPEIRAYRRTLLGLFLSERIAFGSPGLLHLYEVVLKCGLVWLGLWLAVTHDAEPGTRHEMPVLAHAGTAWTVYILAGSLTHMHAWYGFKRLVVGA